MSQRITIEIKDKIATCLTESPIVCGNADYIVDFAFDEEWEKHEVKTAMFVVNGKAIPQVFAGNACPVPVIQNTLIAWVGVFAGTVDDGTLSTSTPALVKCIPCVTDGDNAMLPPPDDVYNQIIGLCEEARNAAKSVETKADNGDFNGEKGDKGDKGENGENGTKWYVCNYTFDVGTKEAAKGMMTAVGMGDIAVGDFFYCINGNIYQVTSIDESNLYFSYKFSIKGEQGEKGVDGTKWYKYNYSFDTSTTSISKGMTDSLCSYDIVIGDYFFDNNGNVFEVTGLNGNQYTVSYKICLKGYVLTSTDKADIANEVISLIPLYNGEVTLDD